MKLKEITAGGTYKKRKAYGWGVVVTTEKTYSFPSYERFSKKHIYEGRGVLVLVNGRFTGTPAKPEDAVAALKLIDTTPSGDIRGLTSVLAPLGLDIEIWLPQEIVGTLEDVRAKEEEEKDYERALRRERAETLSALTTQFDGIKGDLGIDIHATFNTEKSRVSIGFAEWKKLMDRVDSLIQSDPLGNGKL